MARGAAGLLALAGMAAALAGCGGGEGASSGATVRAYVGSTLCAQARRALAAEGAEADGIHLAVVCLPAAGRSGDLDLAAIGANARRATEDSSSVAYVEAPGPAGRFAQPIVEAAGVAWVESSSAAAPIGRVLAAIGESNPDSSLRDQVREDLERP